MLIWRGLRSTGRPASANWLRDLLGTNKYIPLFNRSAYLGTSVSAVVRIWRAHRLKPHRVESFKLSNDTHFIKKICGHRWLAPQSPEHAMVLRCDEKCRLRHLTIRSLTGALSADEPERCVCGCSVLTTIIKSIIQWVKQIWNNTVCKERRSLLFL